MSKKSKNICNAIGIFALSIYIIFAIFKTNDYSNVMMIISACVALVSFSIRLGIEIANDDAIGNSIFIIVICLFDIIMNTMQLLQ